MLVSISAADREQHWNIEDISMSVAMSSQFIHEYPHRLFA